MNYTIRKVPAGIGREQYEVTVNGVRVATADTEFAAEVKAIQPEIEAT